jgi:electron transfer flavoprotein alpha subunit
MILAAAWETERLSPSARELLGAAAYLGAAMASDVVFASLGDASAAADAGCYGASQAFAFDGDLETSANEGALAALTELARELEARTVLLPADERTAEVAPRLAERLGGSAVMHAIGLDVRDGRPVWAKPVFGGKAVAEIAAASEPVVATLRRGAFAAANANGAVASVSTRPAPVGNGDVELLSREAPVAGNALEDASVIVAGGAGLGNGEVFEELEQLADLLGGAVGASLAAVDAGWAPPDRQVGLTGKVVSPDVYFALGISGASQHLAGLIGAKAIVAVNTDPSAPIFSAAHLGVVMDARTFVASMIAQLRR